MTKIADSILMIIEDHHKKRDYEFYDEEELADEIETYVLGLHIIIKENVE